MKIAYLAHCFPTLTETFTYREVEALRREELDVVVFSAKKPNLGPLDEKARSFIADTDYLPSVFSQRVLAAESFSLTRKPLLNSRLALHCATAKPNVDRAWHRLRPSAEFLRGVYLAQVLSESGEFDHIHAQFAMGSATSAWVASQLTGIPFSFTSHSSHYQPVLRQKVRDAAFVVSTSHYDKHRLIQLTGLSHSEHIKVISGGIGIDTSKWLPPTDADDGSILSVGQLGEQKGHPYLVKACAVLRERGHPISCQIAGGGPMREKLENLVTELELKKDVVTLLGATPFVVVKGLVKNCRIFVLACIKANNGATDGIPFAIIEAMAMGKPCISTPVAGITDLIEDGVSGLLVPEKDHVALANALERLLTDEELRRRLGTNARCKVEAEFDERKNAGKLAALFRNSGSTLAFRAGQ